MIRQERNKQTLNILSKLRNSGVPEKISPIPGGFTEDSETGLPLDEEGNIIKPKKKKIISSQLVEDEEVSE